MGGVKRKRYTGRHKDVCIMPSQKIKGTTPPSCIHGYKHENAYILQAT